MSERDPRAEAATLARKGGDDAAAMRELAGNPEISDEIIGFHALCGYPHNACYADLGFMPT
ncbi:MAG TPA: hypothetical protein VFT19_02300 [Solirubrobacterales bacterium]|nr:hypothetical protein [Solirubrobacterales bacterium]